MSDFDFNPDDEVFKPIPDFPGYDISDQGRVRSYWHRTRDKSMGDMGGTKFVLGTTPRRVLKPEIDHGYLRVRLSKEGRNYKRKIHRLVLETFTGPCPVGHESCHADGKRTNNFLENLSWGTKSKNSLDSIQHGTHEGLTHKGTGHPMAKLTDEQVFEIRNLYAHGRLQKDIAGMFGVHKSTIQLIVTRKRWRHLKAENLTRCHS